MSKIKITEEQLKRLTERRHSYISKEEEVEDPPNINEQFLASEVLDSELNDSWQSENGEESKIVDSRS